MRPARAQSAHDLVQPLDLLRREARRRLVEDDELGVARERAQDLDLLLLGERQVDRRSARPSRSNPASAARRSNRSRREPPVDEPGTPRFGAEEDVLGDGQPRDERRPPGRRARCRGSSASRGEPNETGVAPQDQVALVLREDAGDDLAERRLAGAVLADEGVDGAGPDRDRDVVEGAGRSERLAEPANLEVRRGIDRLAAVAISGSADP